MNFLYPQFLFALFTVLIPVIIHLFNFQRYRKVQFSNVTFLKEIKHSTKARSTLKHILILISRILAIMAIVFAFAQPYIPLSKTTSNNSKKASVFIDNSFSLENQNVNGRAFGLAREYGYKIAEQLPTHTNHQVLTNNFTGSEQHLYPSSELNKILAKVTISPKTQNLSRILKRQETAFDSGPFTGYIVSDFQKSQFDFSNIDLDTLNSYFLIPIEPVITENISIDSLWFKSPVHRVNHPEEVHFRITNHGNTDKKNVRTSLLLNNQQKSFANISVPAHSYKDTFLVYNNSNTGWYKGQIEVSDSPIMFDNSLFFSFNISKEIKVLCINSNTGASNISKAFQLEPYFNYTEVNQSNIEFSQLSQTDLLIINDVTQLSTGMRSAVENYVNNGGHLLVFPSTEDSQSDLNNLLLRLKTSTLNAINVDSTRVNYIDFESEIYSTVFTEKNPKINLPNIYKCFGSNSSKSVLQTALLKTINGQDILLKSSSGSGYVYLFTIPLNKDFSNLSYHSIFLPTLYQIAFQSAKTSKPYHTIGTDDFVKIRTIPNSTNNLFHIKNQDYNIDVIPEISPERNEIKLGFHDAILKSGNYELVIQDSIINMLAFNYSRVESNPYSYTVKELNTIIDSLNLSNFTVFNESLDQFSSEFKNMESGIELWKWFVILGLLFLAIEILLIRFFKPSVL